MLAVSLTRTLSHDVGLFIFLSTRMLDGARFYRDIIEPNPPLIIYIHMLPTVVARLLGVSTIMAFHVFAFVLFNYAIISTLPFIKATRYLSGNVAASSMILFCLYLSAFVLPFMWDSYEQREHILCLLALPYLFSCISYLDGDHHVGRTALINTGRPHIEEAGSTSHAGVDFGFSPHSGVLQ